MSAKPHLASHSLNRSSTTWRRGTQRLATLIFFTMLACKLSATFNIQQSGEVNIPAGQSPDVLSFDGFTNLDLANHQTFKSQGLGLDDIDAAELQNITLSVTQPATGVDLSFIKSISVVASADNLPDLTLASTENPAEDVNMISFAVTPNQPLAPYAKAKNFTLSGHASYKKPPQEALTLELTGTLRLTIGEPGAACNN